MSKFIELTNVVDGRKSLLNVNQILEVSTGSDGSVYIEAAAVSCDPKTGEVITYRLTCKESYEQVKSMIKRACDRI